MWKLVKLTFAVVIKHLVKLIYINAFIELFQQQAIEGFFQNGLI